MKSFSHLIACLGRVAGGTAPAGDNVAALSGPLMAVNSDILQSTKFYNKLQVFASHYICRPRPSTLQPLHWRRAEGDFTQLRTNTNISKKRRKSPFAL